MADPAVDLLDDIAAVEAVVTEDSLVEDVLVEEVSIDGMCGVY
jgi:mycofactocin precursor